MPKEPDNLVLKMRRAIRGIVEKHDKHFDGIEKTLEEMQKSITLALGKRSKRLEQAT